MKPFLSRLNYSSVNEDGNSEICALNIQASDKILCITGSGTRVLDLLTQRPDHIVAIDFNPCQGFLLELKIAAIKFLEYEEYLAFWGIAASTDRINIYENIKSSISHDARFFWSRNLKLIGRGIYYQGEWEKYFSLMARYINTVRGELVKKLFAFSDIYEQLNFWNREWNNTSWRFFLRSVSTKAAWKYLLRDPGFYKFIPRGCSVYNYLYQRFNSAAANILYKNSPFMTLLLKAKLDHANCLPPYLRRQNYSMLKEFLPNVEIINASLIDYLRNNKNYKFNSYSLSDISSYTNSEEYNHIWEAMIMSGSTNARICERQFLVKREVPKIIGKRFVRNEPLENELLKRDNSIFYTFTTGTIFD